MFTSKERPLSGLLVLVYAIAVSSPVLAKTCAEEMEVIKAEIAAMPSDAG